MWLILRSVRKPVSALTTAPITSSVCNAPFMSASTWPSRAIVTARAAAAWLCGASTRSIPSSLCPACSAAFLIFATGPTSTGTMRPCSAACSAPLSESLSQGCTTAVRIGGFCRAASIKCWKCWPRSCRCTSGSTTRGRCTFCVGAMTSASPVMTTSPASLTHSQSRMTRFFSGIFSRTLTRTVTVSPSPTGRRNFSD